MFVAKFIALLSLALATNANIPDFIKPCPIKDDECLYNSAKIAFPHFVKGYPEFGIKTFDPLSVATVDGNNGDMKLQLTDVIVKGVSKCELSNIKRPDRFKIDLSLICPIVASGNYNLNGSLLHFPVEGEGLFDITFPKLELTATLKLEKIQKNEVDYYNIASFDFVYQAKEKVRFNFQNLYHGDKEKANQLHQLLDDSWEVIISEVGKPVVKKMVTVVVHGLRQGIKEMPAKEIELD